MIWDWSSTSSSENNGGWRPCVTLLCWWFRGSERGTARPEVLQSLLKTTDRVVQEIDSVEYGLTDIQALLLSRLFLDLPTVPSTEALMRCDMKITARVLLRRRAVVSGAVFWLPALSASCGAI